MTDYLREMALVAENIGQGDLSLKVSPRSVNDSFGIAFRQMMTYLENMAETSDAIASGDLKARVEPKSADDRFGISFKNMLDSTLTLLQSRDERDQLQKDITKLLDEVGGVGMGDLTGQAEVTAGATGAIADSFNFMIDELRKIITNVKGSTVRVKSSADTIQSTTARLANGSVEQARQIASTNQAVQEMAASIQQVSENATLSATVADQSRANAMTGAKAVQNNINGMQRIREQVQETAKRIKRLGERSQEIGEIIQVIDDIADRTSMLVLNASIQAAMAGEAGRGFAVVAEEVERLADRSTNATKPTGALIKSIQSETNDAVTAMEETTREVVQGSTLANEAGQALSEIEQVSDRLAELIQSISQARQQQARGSESVTKAMQNVLAITREIETGSNEAAVSVGSLVTMADNLHGSVAAFRLPEQSRN